MLSISPYLYLYLYITSISPLYHLYHLWCALHESLLDSNLQTPSHTTLNCWTNKDATELESGGSRLVSNLQTPTAHLYVPHTHKCAVGVWRFETSSRLALCKPIYMQGKGRGNGLAVEPMSQNLEGRGSIPRFGSRRSSLISIEHAELLRIVLPRWCCAVRAWHGIACALRLAGPTYGLWCLGQLSPLPTSGDSKWVAAKHCGRAKRSRISDTHRLRGSLQFRYINNQSLLFTLL